KWLPKLTQKLARAGRLWIDHIKTERAGCLTDFPVAADDRQGCGAKGALKVDRTHHMKGVWRTQRVLWVHLQCLAQERALDREYLHAIGDEIFEQAGDEPL